jgi:glycosyltransferase involved in cell wall biosynthesis
MRDELAAQIIRLGIRERVSLYGYVSNPWPLIAQADDFLLSSRWEGMSNAALEALALGVPVIASDEAGGISELLAESPDGAVTVATGAEAFIDAMNTVQCPIAPNGLRESLLPEAFRLQVVLCDFERAIADNLNARY